MKNVKVLNNLWKIRQDYSALHFDVSADFYVFKPKIGVVANGVCKNRAKNHISVVLYKVFNVAIRFKAGTDVSDIMVNSNVKFIITAINLKTSLPYLMGELVRDNANTIFSDDDENADSGINPNGEYLKLKTTTLY